MQLSLKQQRILQFLAEATDWATRQSMEDFAGKKGFSEALGSPRTGIRPDSLEGRNLVRRKSGRQPFEYKITVAGAQAFASCVPSRSAAKSALVTAALLDEELQAAVLRALSDSEISRQARLATAPKASERIATWTYAFLRNPDVVAQVLLRAKGTCESCRSNAPFVRRSNGTPYLEVHHKIQLAAGGEDTVENALALCPNCHRKAHHGYPDDA
jgi:5-methylcytosine-specific restriction enzyme A